MAPFEGFPGVPLHIGTVSGLGSGKSARCSAAKVRAHGSGEQTTEGRGDRGR